MMKHYMTYLKYAFDDFGSHRLCVMTSAAGMFIYWVFLTLGFALGVPEIAAVPIIIFAPVFIAHAALFLMWRKSFGEWD